MAVKTIQIADKPTLDATKALLENGEYGLSAIKNAVASGSSGGSSGGLQIEKYVDESITGNVIDPTPTPLYVMGNYTSIVVYNDELHLLGNGTYHYKYDGNIWTEVSTLPYEFNQGTALVWNDEIHILGGGSSGYYTNHYKYNGSSWDRVSTLPYGCKNIGAVVYNDEIHIFGGEYISTPSSRTYHYKYNGSSWERVSTLPYDFDNTSGKVIVWNDAIHILGGIVSSENRTKHYKYNGSSWERVSTLPYELQNNDIVILNNEIHIFCGEKINSIFHYKYDGSSWIKLSSFGNRQFYYGEAAVINKNIHIFGGDGITNKSHYIVKNDNRHIATMLPKGSHIMLSDNEDINYVSNATKVSNNIAEVTETGYVEVLATLPENDDIKGYLTFY